jgi:hypothetical protein
MWREFRKMRWWGQVVVGGLTFIFVLIVLGAIFGEEDSNDGGTEQASDRNVSDARTKCETRLVVASPRSRATVHSRKIRVRGRTEPGAYFTIGGRDRVRKATARSDGRFAENFNLSVGRTELKIRAVAAKCLPSVEWITVRRKRTAAELAALRQQRADKKARKAAAQAQYAANYKASATSIPYKQLNKNADEYKGTKVTYRGQIFQIQEDAGTSVILLSVTDEGYDFWTDHIWVDYSGEIDSAEDDIITVWGQITGSKSYETQAGGETYVPRMRAKYIGE